VQLLEEFSFTSRVRGDSGRHGHPTRGYVYVSEVSKLHAQSNLDAQQPSVWDLERRISIQEGGIRRRYQTKVSTALFGFIIEDTNGRDKRRRCGDVEKRDKSNECRQRQDSCLPRRVCSRCGLPMRLLALAVWESWATVAS
jgi:hypothetical protein